MNLEQNFELRDDRIPVELTGTNQVVLAVPAKPKPKTPWWQRVAFAGFVSMFPLLLALWIAIWG